MNPAIIKKAISEFREYPAKVRIETGKGSVFYWMSDMAWCLMKYGARPIDYYRFKFYNLNRFERNRYLTFYRYMKIAKKLIRQGVIFADKVKEYNQYSPFINRAWMPTRGVSSHELKEFIVSNGECIAKPNRGEQGKGIYVVSNDIIANNHHILEELSSCDYILEAKLANCKELDRINHSSLNTLRVYTMLDKTGKPVILNMMLRIGKTGSDVDNWGAGGVAYEINLDEGIVHGYGIDKQCHKHLKHPGTDFVMPGFKIPQYPKVLEMIEKLCRIDSNSRLVGWDIAITPDGPELIEMNCPAGHDILQAFGSPFYEKIKQLW